MIREPAVAGTFYPATSDTIRKIINEISLKEGPGINLELGDRNILGAICPHAGYKFSGYEAIHVFRILERSEARFDTVIIINPNHRGTGPPVALDDNNGWKTPLGIVDLDLDFMDNLPYPKSAAAHRNEHSGEVIVPFLQLFLKNDFRIVPISVTNQDPDTSRSLAEEILNANKKMDRKILVLASSDFSHYVDPDEGEKRDKKVIEAILSLDPIMVFEQIKKTGASVCGYGPIMTLMFYVNMTGKNPVSTLLKFGNSGKLKPVEAVVDYASILFYDQ